MMQNVQSLETSCIMCSRGEFKWIVGIGRVWKGRKADLYFPNIDFTQSLPSQGYLLGWQLADPFCWIHLPSFFSFLYKCLEHETEIEINMCIIIISKCDIY